LGVLQQDDVFNGNNKAKGLWRGGEWYGTVSYPEAGIDEPALPTDATEGRKVEVSRSLREAIEYVALHDGGEKITVPNFEDNLFGYFQMQNYIIRAFGPDVVFGWMENV
jgi:hypothetical protein